MEGRQYFGGIACGNVSSDDGWAAIHHAIGQCVSGEYSCGHCAVYLLGCVQAEAESELLSGGGDDALWRLLPFSDGGFSSGFRGRAVTLGCGGVFAANGVSGESDQGLRFCAYCDCGESFDPCGDDGDSDAYGMGYAASDIACLRKLFLHRGILHRALFCAAKHRTAKHCAEQGGNHHYNGIYFCGGIFCDFIRRTDALQGISGVCGDFCGNGFGGKACAGEKIAVDKANKIE